MPISIVAIRTLNQQNRNATFFRRRHDALSLTMDISASGDVLVPPEVVSPEWGVALFDAIFQIIDPMTDKVIVNEVWEAREFTWGPNFWISSGNWGGPESSYTTPERWGLGSGIFGFRGIVKAYGQILTTEGVALTEIPDEPSFDVSDIRWIRVEDV